MPLPIRLFSVIFGLSLVVAPATTKAQTAALSATPAAHPASVADFVPGQIIVRYWREGVKTLTASASGREIATRTVHVPLGQNIMATARQLASQPGVITATPNFIAHASESQIPANSLTAIPGGWAAVQWNLLPGTGVDAPTAWANLIQAGHPGGKGVTVAVLDTGVAYSSRHHFNRSPDLSQAEFVRGYDFVSHTPFAFDRNGHGTDVASTIAEAGRFLRGLAYGVKIMPVRVLNSAGEGDSKTIAAGIRFAAAHHAKIVNLSFEYSPSVRPSDIPGILSALRYAWNKGSLVIAAAGNEGGNSVALPARSRFALSVGATTEHLCAADYSNSGSNLGLVAPGGGADANLPGDPHCQPQAPPGRNIFQVTFKREGSVHQFGIPDNYFGTSMATPHVAATAALIVASGVIGPNPSPAAIIARLKATATPLGTPALSAHYGAGLVNAGKATTPNHG